jgi:hypothetical protein
MRHLAEADTRYDGTFDVSWIVKWYCPASQWRSGRLREESNDVCATILMERRIAPRRATNPETGKTMLLGGYGTHMTRHQDPSQRHSRTADPKNSCQERLPHLGSQCLCAFLQLRSLLRCLTSTLCHHAIAPFCFGTGFIYAQGMTSNVSPSASWEIVVLLFAVRHREAVAQSREQHEVGDYDHVFPQCSLILLLDNSFEALS